jgi:hypothetical protein
VELLVVLVGRVAQRAESVEQSGFDVAVGGVDIMRGGRGIVLENLERLISARR